MGTRRTTLPVVYVALLAAAPLQALAVRIDYSASVGYERDDNVLMSSTDPTESSALRAGFGFVVSEETSTVQANVGGRIEYWNYIDGPQSDAFESSLAGRVNWFIVPGTFSFTVEDSLEMRPIDRFAPDTVDNRQRVNVLALGPNLHFNWNQALRGLFELRWMDTSAEDADEYESQRVNAALHAIRELDPSSSVTMSLRGSDVDFKHDLIARDYRRYDAYVRYQKQLARLGFALDAGYTWVDFDDGESASHPMLRGRVEWQASPRQSLALGISHQLTDASDAAISGIAAATVVPDRLSSTSSTVDASVYEEDRFELNYAWQHERIGVSAGPYYERIDFLDAGGFDETRRGAVLELSYRAAPTWDVRAYADVARSTFDDIGLRTDDKRVGAGLVKTWSRRWSSALDYLHYQREDNGLLGRSRQNVWYLTVTYRNR